MNMFIMLYASLVTIILVTFLMNTFQIFMESKKLIDAGKTPLYGRNILTVFLAAAAEIVVIYLIVFLAISLSVPETTVSFILIFLVGYVLRNAGSYLMAWSLWSIFIKIDTRKMKKEIEKEREGAI